MMLTKETRSDCSQTQTPVTSGAAICCGGDPVAENEPMVCCCPECCSPLCCDSE